MSNPRQRALILAVQMLGGEAAASDTLDTSTGELSSWLGGRLDPPVSLLMRALDVILDDPALAARHAVLLAAQDKERSASAPIH